MSRGKRDPVAIAKAKLDAFSPRGSDCPLCGHSITDALARLEANLRRAEADAAARRALLTVTR